MKLANSLLVSVSLTLVMSGHAQQQQQQQQQQTSPNATFIAGEVAKIPQCAVSFFLYPLTQLPTHPTRS